jgi:ABC-2 type transport system permease protein/sodium transport system permease protein
MNRFSRINTIWRKELIDTLRDRRTLIAMIFVPMVLYPAMMLGSLQGFELQFSRLTKEEYRVAVNSAEARDWLRWVLDTDPARRPGVEGLPAERVVELAQQTEPEPNQPPGPPTAQQSAEDAARARVREHPPEYVIEVVPDLQQLREQVAGGKVNVGLVVHDGVPERDSLSSTEITLIVDQTDVRSQQIAAPGLESVLQRLGEFMLAERLAQKKLDEAFVHPIDVQQEAIASPEKVGGSILGQIVPLILVIMTITGAIYPAIDLTAGERERGTLETLMVAPVPTVDLIAGKFVVVALIAMLSAALNLLSIGGTIYLGGLGNLLSRGGQVIIPLNALPWVLMVLVPLAIMFSATLLAVCSFARSFKEAQNYVMPVMVAAMIPSVVGILPGTRLEGPLLIVPVTNIVILTRDLFMGRFDVFAIVWVMLSTTLYAGAAVAIAAKLFGQEAVLFADTGSFKTLLRRKFFKPADRPTVAQAFFLLAVVFSANFFIQQRLLTAPGIAGTMWFWVGLGGVIVVLFGLVPCAAAAYMRVRIRPALGLTRPHPAALVAGLCFGLSTWILAQGWFAFQQNWLPMAPEMERAYEQMEAILGHVSPLVMIVFLALIPAICEELFFRGYALSGLRGGLGKVGAVLVVAVAFGVYHQSVHRLIVTSALGALFGLLVIQYRSIWPAMLAHFLHNGLSGLGARDDGLKPLLTRLGYALNDAGLPPVPWMIGAGVLLCIGVLLCVRITGREKTLENAAVLPQHGAL